jgi:hypothetical protein
VVRFGIAFDQIDLLGGYFTLNCIALVLRLRALPGNSPGGGIQFVACALAIPATALFLGKFLGTFDSFYRVNQMASAYLLRGLFLATSVTTLGSMAPRRFFHFPKFLLVITCIVTAAWLFVYSCPSIVREWYGTRTEPSAFFPEGMLIFERRNPERLIQGQLLVGAAISWVALIVTGRILANLKLRRRRPKEVEGRTF